MIKSFYNTHIDKVWDKYGNETNVTSAQWYEPYGGQCVSLVKTYLLYIFGDKVKNSYGNAVDFWTSKSSNGILELCDPVSEAEDGDIVISSGSTPQYGHIWIYYKGQALSQNVLGDPRTRLYPIDWQGEIYGILRPKKIHINEEIESRSEITKETDGAVYRLYNNVNGDHLYTVSYDEANQCCQNGWKYEGVGWVSPKDGCLVMRLCNPYNGIHHYSSDQKEIETLKMIGWQLEGAAFRSSGSSPIYRMYNPNGGEHVLSASDREHNQLCRDGWICEGQPLRY